MLQPGELRKACAAVSDGLKEYPHLSEAVYQRALQLELQRHYVDAVETEVVLPVEYRGMHVGTVRADLVAHPKPNAEFPHCQETVIELKRASKITQSHIDQLNTYLALSMRQTGNTVHGAVVNFGVQPAQIHFEDGNDFWLERSGDPDPDPDPDTDPNPDRTRSPLRAKSRSRSRSPERVRSG